MSDAATALHHPAVEPAESPLTPESWGKLGMWVFLAGDAVGIRRAPGLLRGPAGRQRRLAEPGPSARHPAHRADDVPPDLLERDHGEGARESQASNLPRAKMFLLLTALGGAIFVGLQAFEWTHLIERGLMIFGNPWGATLFGASFFIITGFHGLHVTAGVIYLLAIYRVVSRGSDMRYNYMVTEIAGLYWHFVDLVWIMVFTFIYLL